MMGIGATALLMALQTSSFPNQAGSCHGVGGVHLVAVDNRDDNTAQRTKTSLSDHGFVVTANDVLLGQDSAHRSHSRINTTTSSSLSFVNVKIRATTGRTFKGALLRVESTRSDVLFDLEASTQNAQTLDPYLCGAATAVQAVSHTNSHPKTELGAMLTLVLPDEHAMLSSFPFLVNITVVQANNPTMGSHYATSSFSWQVDVTTTPSGLVSGIEVHKDGAPFSLAESTTSSTTTPCRSLCPLAEELRHDGTMVRWREEENTSSSWIDCRDLPVVATQSYQKCRVAKDTARDVCCVPRTCPLPCHQHHGDHIPMLWPHAQVPLRGRSVPCHAVAEQWEGLVAVRSCRISRLLVETHCGCASSATSNGVILPGTTRGTRGWSATITTSWVILGLWWWLQL